MWQTSSLSYGNSQSFRDILDNVEGNGAFSIFKLAETSIESIAGNWGADSQADESDDDLANSMSNYIQIVTQTLPILGQDMTAVSFNNMSQYVRNYHLTK